MIGEVPFMLIQFCEVPVPIIHLRDAWRSSRRRRGSRLHPESGSWFGFPASLTEPFIPPEWMNCYQICLKVQKHCVFF